MQDKQIISQDNKTPFVTFIVTCYNIPTAMLCQCLDSIIALSLRSVEREIIVVDDGSNESPLDKLESYLNDIVYVHQQNAGLSEARNRGIQIATGQYIQFVDADDYLIRTPYEHCLDIARYQQPDIVMFDFTNTNDRDKKNAIFNNNTPKSGVEYLSQHNLQATSCGYLFKQNILGNLRFTPGIYHEDEEFTPQLLLRAEKICSTDAQAYYYRLRPHSITTDTNVRRVIMRLNDRRLIIDKLNLISDTLPTYERTALQRRVAQLTMDYIYNIIIQTGNRHYLERKLQSLRSNGLFPLPDRDYTTKYKWFRHLTNSSMGMTILMHTLPLVKKER